MKSGFGTIHNTHAGVGYIVFSTYRGELERTGTIGVVWFVIGNSARSNVGNVNSSTLSKSAEVAVGDSIGSTNGIEDVVAEGTLFVTSSSISVLRSLISDRKALSGDLLLTPSLGLHFLAQQHEDTLVGEGLVSDRTDWFVAEDAVREDWISVVVEEVLSVVILSETLRYGHANESKETKQFHDYLLEGRV